MSKQNPHSKTQPTNRVGASMSIGQKIADQIKEQTGSTQQSQHEVGFVPTYEDIQRRAYQIHEEKGGNDFENWLEAEQMLKEEHTGSPSFQQRNYPV